MRQLGPSDHVVVVGAGLAGWRFIEAARRNGFEGSITLVGEERYAPYDRPPFSKQVLVGKWPPDHTTLATAERVASANVTMRLGVKAIGLDVASTTVRLEDGDEVRGSHVVVATGARARQLPFSAGALLHTLRTRDDVERLDNRLTGLGTDSVVAVIGGGFIGAEVATALKTRGFTTVVLEAAPRPLFHALGPVVSLWLADLAAAAGVDLRSDQHVADVIERGGQFAVTFDDGEELVAGAVVVGAGAVPNVEWLATSGLNLDNGVVVDRHLLATETIGAIGDVARFEWGGSEGAELVRIEHWQVANDHATALAHFWTQGRDLETPFIAYFWSDQYGKKIQMIGHPSPGDEVTMVHGSVEESKWLAVYSRRGVVTGVVALSNPRALTLSRPLLERTIRLDEAVASAPWAS